MGVMMTKDQDQRSELNSRITADLREKVQTSGRVDPDLAEDSAYLENTRKTGRFTWVWIVLVVLAILSLICIIFI